MPSFPKSFWIIKKIEFSTLLFQEKNKFITTSSNYICGIYDKASLTNEDDILIIFYIFMLLLVICQKCKFFKYKKYYDNGDDDMCYMCGKCHYLKPYKLELLQSLLLKIQPFFWLIFAIVLKICICIYKWIHIS